MDTPSPAAQGSPIPSTLPRAAGLGPWGGPSASVLPALCSRSALGDDTLHSRQDVPFFFEESNTFQLDFKVIFSYTSNTWAHLPFALTPVN